MAPSTSSFVPAVYSSGMIIALTGTPGTGKSTVARYLSSQGWKVLEVNELAKRYGLLKSKDVARDSFELDPDDLQQALVQEGMGEGVLVGHLAHLLDVNMVIVLRCHPSKLAERLADRGWPLAKVRENALAEALDIILAESMDGDAPVFEIDTTEMTPEGAAEATLSILAGENEKYAVGNIDWSEEALLWS
ncbi:MAG: dephospho-CoA kinase [Methanomassiliicoccus sp.]|nr:MAG: dephospho-CoA kinase [Methanomassiliicoccus sp.]